jgi:predicted anti-sigma-YlaC factor YlaD
MTRRLFLDRECARARSLGSQAQDVTLSDLERRALDEHLRRCPDCTVVVAEIGRVIRLVRAAPALAPPALAPPALAPPAAFVVSPPRRRIRGGRFLLAGVSIVAAAGLGVVVATPGLGPEGTSARAAVGAEQPSLNQTLAMARTFRLWRLSQPRSQGSPHPDVRAGATFASACEADPSQNLDSRVRGPGFTWDTITVCR